MLKPESKLASKVKLFLEDKGWSVLNTHGNKYQQGFPDKYCIHPKYGQRWVELKVKDKHVFTPSQLFWFPVFHACRVGIWIMVEASEGEYEKLFRPPNWYNYLSSRELSRIREVYPDFLKDKFDD